MELVCRRRQGTLLLLCALMGFFTQASCAQVDVDRKEQIVLEGDSVSYMCRVAVPIQYCRVELPGPKSYNLNKGISNYDISYFGEGLDAGQCGFTIHKADEKKNGEIKCSVGIASDALESVGTMSLVVARSPKPPELDLSRGADQLNVYRVDDIIQATCMVRDGRPVANISWYLDADLVHASELGMPTVLDLAKENLQSKIQNLTRRLRASDNGKFLRCIGFHPAYPGGQAEAKRRLDIKYAPLPQRLPIEEFGYEIGKTGVINVTVEANPRPTIEWNVDGQRIREGSHDNTGSVEAEVAQEMGNGKYLATLRIARISKMDTEKDYVLTAYNDQGSEEYRVKISTNPEPKGYELGMAAIVGIIAAIIFVFLVATLLIFAKLKGRWCFSGNGESRYIAESDTESADVRPKEKKMRLPSIQLTASFFKKKTDKVASETDPNVRTLESDEADTATITAEEQAEEVADKKADKDKNKGIVYAELDLIRSSSPNVIPTVKKDDEKTEYAEIVYTPVNETDKKRETEK